MTKTTKTTKREPASRASASEAPATPKLKTAPTGKLALLADMLRRPQGATIADLSAATKWQTHSVRGAMSGGLKKGFGFTITSEKVDGVRVYRLGEPAA